MQADVADRDDARHARVDRPQRAQRGRGCSASRSSSGWSSAPRPTAGRWSCSWSRASPTTLDGYLARRLNQTSRLGQILDPVADRLYILAVVVGLALRDIDPVVAGDLLPLRDLLLWGLVPLLRTRGYSALPVHFLGKAATFNLLYAFPLLLLGDGEGSSRPLAEVFGWAFAFWGIGLYWWAGVLYALAGLQAARDDRAPQAVAMRETWLTPEPTTRRPRPPARPGDDAAARPGHPARRSTRTTCTSPARRARRAAPAPAHAPRRVVRRAVVADSCCSGCWSPSRPCRPRATPVHEASRAQLIDQIDQRRRRSPTLQRPDRSLRRQNDRAAVEQRAVSSSRARSRRPVQHPAARDQHRLRGGPRPRAADHRRRQPGAAARRPGARLRPRGSWSTGCGRPAPRRSRSTASGSRSLTLVPQRRHRRSR